MRNYLLVVKFLKFYYHEHILLLYKRSIKNIKTFKTSFFPISTCKPCRFEVKAPTGHKSITFLKKKNQHIFINILIIYIFAPRPICPRVKFLKLCVDINISTNLIHLVQLIQRVISVFTNRPNSKLYVLFFK